MLLESLSSRNVNHIKFNKRFVSEFCAIRHNQGPRAQMMLSKISAHKRDPTNTFQEVATTALPSLLCPARNQRF